MNRRVQWTLTVLIVGVWLGFGRAPRARGVPLADAFELVGALREGDFSVRGRSPRPDDAMGEVMREVNTLGRPCASSASARWKPRPCCAR